MASLGLFRLQGIYPDTRDEVNNRNAGEILVMMDSLSIPSMANQSASHASTSVSFDRSKRLRRKERSYFELETISRLFWRARVCLGSLHLFWFDLSFAFFSGSLYIHFNSYWNFGTGQARSGNLLCVTVEFHRTP